MNDDSFKRDTETLGGGSNLKDAIAENAKGPKKVEGDAGTVEQHSLRDQIEAERFLQSQKATQRPGLGIRLTKLAPDGTI